jgi:hypothetical protein
VANNDAPRLHDVMRAFASGNHEAVAAALAQTAEAPAVNSSQIRDALKAELAKRTAAVPILRHQLEAMFDEHRAAGLAPIAVHGPDSGHPNAGKAPRRDAWQQHDAAAERALLQDGDNIGWLCGIHCDSATIFVGADLDFDDDQAVQACLQNATAFKGKPVRYGKPGRALVPMRMAVDTASRDVAWHRLSDGKTAKLQTIARGRQFVAVGIHPGTRQYYRWEGSNWTVKSWPVTTFDELLSQMDTALAPLSYVRVEKPDSAAPRERCELPADMTDQERVALRWWGQNSFVQTLNGLRKKGAGQFRGTSAFAGCTTVAPLVWAGILNEADLREQLFAVHPESDVGRDVNRGFEAGNLHAITQLRRLRGEQSIPLAASDASAQLNNVKSAGQLIMEQLMKATEKVKVLWNGDSYRTLLDASLALARGSRDRVFASSVSGRLSTVGFVNGRATAENFLTADHVKEEFLRTVLVLYPVVYAPANVGDGVVAPEKVPPGIKLIKTAVDGPRNTTIVKTARTCEGVADAFNAAAVLTDGATGKPKHDPETTVWLPVEKLDSLTLKLAVERVMATLDGVVLQEMLGVFQGPQMLPNGSVVSESGLHAARGTSGVPGEEVAFIDVGEVAGMIEPMPIDRARAVLKGYVKLFPYGEPEDGAVLAALAVTGFCRLAFKLAPLTLIDAPAFGAGKTFAAERIAGLNGIAPLAIACTNKSRDSGDEMRKRIETECITGQAGFKILDDVPGGELPNVESFRTMLTSNSAKCSVRVLGESRAVEVSPAKFTWIATGNNVRVSEDMVRRSVHARLDRDKAEVWGWVGEKAAEAVLDRIKDDPKARAEIISAILSLLQHVRQTGAGLHRLSNFEGWSALPREVAYLVMEADPVATQARLRQNDEKAIEHSAITTALLQLIGTEAQADGAVGFMLAHDIAKHVAGTSEMAPFVTPGALPEHVTELRHHFDAKDPRELHNRLLAWLRQHRDRRTAPDEDGASYAVVRRKLRDPKHRNMRDHWGIAVHRRTASKAFPWQV